MPRTCQASQRRRRLSQVSSHVHKAAAAETNRTARHVPWPVQVAHYGVAGAVRHLLLAVPRCRRRVLLPVAAGDAGAELVGERRDQRGHHQQRVGVVAHPGVGDAAAAAYSPSAAELLLVHGGGVTVNWQRRVHTAVGVVAHLQVTRRRPTVGVHARLMSHGTQHTHGLMITEAKGLDRRRSADGTELIDGS